MNVRIEKIESAHLNINIPNVYGFADDINVVTKNNANSIQGIFDEYENFSNNSGLVLNAEKTEILCFNREPNNVQDFQVRYRGVVHDLKSSKNIKVNGVFFQQDPAQREELNVTKVVTAVEKLLGAWSTRRLTLIGRVLILKTFAISQATYLLQ